MERLAKPRCVPASTSSVSPVTWRDWGEASRSASFDAFLESALWSCLELIEADELDAADAPYLARVKLAVSIAGVDALEDDVRDKLVELGVIEG